MDAFFAAYAFRALPADVHPHAHFCALLAAHAWAPSSRSFRRAHAAFMAALRTEFVARHGDAAAPPLETWQRLCMELGARELPESITKCKKVGGSSQARAGRASADCRCSSISSARTST